MQTVETKFNPFADKDNGDLREESAGERDSKRDLVERKASKELYSYEDGGQEHLLLKSESIASKEEQAAKNQAKTVRVGAEPSQTTSLSQAARLLSDVTVSLESMKQEGRSKLLTTGKDSILSQTEKRLSSKVRPSRYRRVRFSPESLMLNAALEGDLSLLHQCVLQVYMHLLSTCVHVA